MSTSTPGFRRLEAGRIEALALRYRSEGRRRVAGIHLHATRVPSAQDFRELAESLDSAELAGRQWCERLWRHHTAHRGFAHLGAHLVVDPEGGLWLARPWDLPPVSVRGLNGNLAYGPLCVAVIGDFDAGRERLEGAQREALVVALAALADVFGLGPETIEDAAAIDERAGGGGIDVGALREAVAGSDRERFDPRAGGSDHEWSDPTGPLLSDGTPLTPEQRRLEADSDLDEGSVDAILAALSAGDGARGGSRATTLPRRETLARHVINLRLGELSDTGEIGTSPEDVERLFARDIEEWIAALPEDRVPRLMFHAHGGLTDEARGAAYAARWHRWWLEQGVWPIYFVWETGAVETLLQLVETSVGRRSRGLGDTVSALRDRALEELVHRLGRGTWETMKLSARRAAEDGERAGSRLVAEHLSALLRRHPGRLECHAVGHSAGAIFHAYFLRECLREGREVPIRSLSLLAPACTTALFEELLRGPIEDERIERFHLFLLDRRHERRDPSVPGYGKSLLHLVSRGFERERGTPLLGLEESIRQDPALMRALGLAAEHRPRVATVFAPSADEAVATRRSAATTHGAFDEDPATMTSVALAVRGEIDPDEVPAVPASARRSRAADGTPRLFEPLASRLDEDLIETLGLSPAPPAPARPPAADAAAAAPTGADAAVAPATEETDLRADGSGGDRERPAGVGGTRRGERRALCIGIDAYAGDLALEGCVGDARNWSAALGALGFRTRLLLDAEATHRGILDAIRALTEGARPGDTVAVQYSGHGVQFPDSDGDEADGNDEALVPVDSAERLFIADDELWEALEAHADGVEVCVFMDCCHSRSNSRAVPPPGARARLVRPTPAMIAAHRERMAARRRGRSVMRRAIEDMRHVKFSACADRELAYEERGQGNFSRAAVGVLRALREPMSYEEVRLAIERGFRPDARQHPGLECATERRGRPFLDGARLRGAATPA